MFREPAGIICVKCEICGCRYGGTIMRDSDIYHIECPDCAEREKYDKVMREIKEARENE